MQSLKLALLRTASLFFACGVAVATAGFNFFNPSNRDSIPKLISGTGMYQNILTKTLTPDITLYEINAPLWTDGAVKARYIALPKGTSAVFSDSDDVYAYPNGAMV